MPDLPSPRKPPSRFWLYAPYALLLVVILSWSAAWLVISHVAAARMDETAARLRSQGWSVDWARRQVGGYPFRLNVRLQSLHIAEPSGWSLAAPGLEAEAYAYAPEHWVMVAPQGVTLTRPDSGAVMISGQVLRASIARLAGQSIPQVAIDGRALTVAPQTGAKPLPITAADRFALYLRPLAGDQAEFQLQLTGAAPLTGGLLASLSNEGPLNLVWDETLSHVSALAARDWPSAVRRWSAAGGDLTLVHGALSAGGVSLTARSGRTVVDGDGYLSGSLKAGLARTGGGLMTLGEVTVLAPRVENDLDLRGGKLRLGPFVLGKAPKVY